VNVRVVFRIQFIVCNWILLTKENMASDPKIKVEKLLGATNWAKCKWKMNMHFKQYDVDYWWIVKMSQYNENRKGVGMMIKKCWCGCGITTGRRRQSWVRWVNRLRIWYWRPAMPRTYRTSSSTCMKRAVLNDWVYWWQSSSHSSVIQKWTLLLCRCSQEVILRHVYRAASTRVARHTDSTAARADPCNNETWVPGV